MKNLVHCKWRYGRFTGKLEPFLHNYFSILKWNWKLRFASFKHWLKQLILYGNYIVSAVNSEQWIKSLLWNCCKIFRHSMCFTFGACVPWICSNVDKTYRTHYTELLYPLICQNSLESLPANNKWNWITEWTIPRLDT